MSAVPSINPLEEPDNVIPSCSATPNNSLHSITTSIDSNQPHVPRRLPPVSPQNVIQFPPEHIFQISQCLEPFISENKCKPKRPNGSMLVTDVPSSVISHENDYEEEEIVEAKKPMEMADAVQLPIDEIKSKLLCFNEALVVSRVDGPDDGTNEILLRAERSEKDELHPLLNVDRMVPMGGMAINVSLINDKFVVNSATQFTFEGKQTASATIQAEYTKEMEVQYEKRCETLCSRDGKFVCLFN